MASPSFEQLQSRLERLVSSAVTFEGIVYRSSIPKYATEADLLTGAGSRLNGGRWNPKGIAVVYVSLTPETAMSETLAHHRYYGIPIEDAMPRTFVAIEVKLKSILDLRVGTIRQRLQVSEAQILTVDWRTEAKAGREPVTQRLGRAVHSGAWEGLIVPSATKEGGHNLLIFPENLGSSCVVKPVNPERLGKS